MLAALCEGTPINAVARAFRVNNRTILYWYFVVDHKPPTGKGPEK